MSAPMVSMIFNTPFRLDHFPVQGHARRFTAGSLLRKQIFLSFYKSITDIEKQKSRTFCLQCGSFP
ncbi:hypothetical cytosolic protein [Syntrophus aciditrophicus SB]|uniref:Hypothetical cytosolic protein n=1 Tax=Syntrophus aciditrophicus (strain SB) TaxID=56780 RepID=Q2LXP2_SYNAS|nr:hypothetical cytosolic protein [Syntrophus aciditrophicus SB]